MFEELLESGFADLIEALLRGVAFGRKNYLALIYRDVETVITGRLQGFNMCFAGFRLTSAIESRVHVLPQLQGGTQRAENNFTQIPRPVF